MLALETFRVRSGVGTLLFDRVGLNRSSHWKDVTRDLLFVENQPESRHRSRVTGISWTSRGRDRSIRRVRLIKRWPLNSGYASSGDHQLVSPPFIASVSWTATTEPVFLYRMQSRHRHGCRWVEALFNVKNTPNTHISSSTLIHKIR